MLNRKVLVLNQNYEPLSICSAKRALVLVFLGKAEVVEEAGTVHTVSKAFPLPSVVRLWIYVRKPRNDIPLTKRNILRRDGHRCQYCGTTQGPMTVDHVVPKDMGGKDTWENLVCCCMRCNNRKGNRTPEQAGMRLLRPPRSPNFLYLVRAFVGEPEPSWKPYLFMD
ncbi:MAG TPA: HNH endonuclease [Candidatus Latescibacteria bacterium]|nr:HNH endonuclease [Candidatus Latescibacterota bacterium]